jgi:MoxR-like ATPase
MATAELRTATAAASNGQPGHDDAAAVRKVADARERIKHEVARVIVGQSDVIDLMLVSMLCRGHVLLHGVPGLGKTLMAKTLADTLAMDFRRVQFTPDLMPSDITGTDVLRDDPQTGKHTLEFLPGPVFTNFLLADEINRTPPKTQAALLQAMQETEVTVGRQTMPVPRPFFVVATQNPIEMEGTYPLPEAQLDRFMFSLRVAYPSVEEEARIIKGTTGTAIAKAAPAMGIEEVVRLQELVRGVPIADSVVNYAARLVNATRPGCGGPGDLHKYIAYGASPRASQCLVLGAKARALLAGRFHVDFADLKALAAPVLRHRLVLNFLARADKVDADMLVERLLAHVPQEA